MGFAMPVGLEGNRYLKKKKKTSYSGIILSV